MACRQAAATRHISPHAPEVSGESLLLNVLVSEVIGILLALEVLLLIELPNGVDGICAVERHQTAIATDDESAPAPLPVALPTADALRHLSQLSCRFHIRALVLRLIAP